MFACCLTGLLAVCRDHVLAITFNSYSRSSILLLPSIPFGYVDQGKKSEREKVYFALLTSGLLVGSLLTQPFPARLPEHDLNLSAHLIHTVYILPISDMKSILPTFNSKLLAFIQKP